MELFAEPWVGYLLSLAVAAAICAALTPLLIRWAVRRGMLDHPTGHKSHVTPTPYLGGLAIVLGFVLAVAGAALLRVAAGSTTGGLSELLVILGVALAVSLVGLLDDLRGLSVTTRFGVQLVAAGTLWASGVRVDLVPVEVAGIAVIDLLITVVWIVGITNAMNLLDNMDGLSAGIATIAALWFGLLGALNGQILVAALAFALAGGTLGFLRQNRPPARIYMGDAGSLFLGILLATLGIKLDFATDAVPAALIPILVLTVPVMDTTLVVLARLKHGVSPFRGGRDHISHRLVKVGIPVPVAVLLIVGAGFAHGWMALVLSRVDLLTGLLAAGLVFLLDTVLFVLLAKVPVYDNSRGRDLVIARREHIGATVTPPEPPR